MGKYNTKFKLDNENNSHTQMVINTPEGSDVLEFGCSKGHVSKHFKKKGCTVTGIEIDSEMAELAKEHCESTHVANIDDLDFKKLLNKQYDVITFGDVLEHLKHPGMALEYIADILKDDGKLLVSLPNITFGHHRLELLKGSLKYEASGILDRTHVNFFDANGAYDLFESSGYYIKDFIRIKQEVPLDYVLETLIEAGLDDSDEAVDNIMKLRDFEVFQFYVVALKATEENLKRIQRMRDLENLDVIENLKKSKKKSWWKKG